MQFLMCILKQTFCFVLFTILLNCDYVKASQYAFIEMSVPLRDTSIIIAVPVVHPDLNILYLY